MSMAGSRIDLTSRTKPGLHLMAMYAFEQIRKVGHMRDTPAPALSRREREVLLWSAKGFSAQEIGARLGLSPRTVETHVTTAAAKLGARNKVQAVVRAVQDRLIVP